MNIECVVDGNARIGEGAFWDGRDNCLWWVDIPAGLIHRFDPASGVNTSLDFGEPVGCLAVRESGGLVVAAKSGFYFFDPESGERTAIHDPEENLPMNRFNDGGCDRQGRFWAGTMRDASPRDSVGSFYRLDADGSVTRGLDMSFHTTNGLAFSPDGRRMYVADSDPDLRSIWEFDYDTETGEPSNRRLFFDTTGQPGRPDGGTVDADGCYWMAAVDSWQVVRITPEGKIDRSIELPVERPTKPMFGGEALDTLFVTSLSLGLAPGSEQPLAGGLFAITGIGVTGVPEARFAG